MSCERSLPFCNYELVKLFVIGSAFIVYFFGYALVSSWLTWFLPIVSYLFFSFKQSVGELCSAVVFQKTIM